MLTLGIETSCDETSCAVLDGRDRILSNIIASSLFKHKPFGGVVPEIASRHSLEQIDTVYRESLSEAGVGAEQLELIAVTEGPGLIGSLFVGICFAKALSFSLRLPLVGVNHLEAHLAANFIGAKMPEKFIGLLISGGHTSLSLHEGEKVSLLGQTIDDAVGEAFDKVAKVMGLEYPGGPVIEKLAREGNEQAFQFTKPKQSGPFDFSFSGIKTAVLYEVRKTMSSPDGSLREPRPRPSGERRNLDCGLRRNDAQTVCHSGERRNPLPPAFVRDMAASFQKSVADWILDKSLAALAETGARDLVVGGGVSANGYLKGRLKTAAEEAGVCVHFPERILALDNAAMIARRGIELVESGAPSSDPLRMTAQPNLSLLSR